MSEPIQNFEFILKKNSSKQPLRLYSDNKQQNKPTLKPQDVISSVSKQLKAIQVADSFKSDAYTAKDLQKYKKSAFLSVNNLPVYDEAPKTTTKFDTQCVSDTQLINIIEDAEMVDVHRGMTQEFETTFVHHTEKHVLEDDKRIDVNKFTEDKEDVGENVILDKELCFKINEEIQLNKREIISPVLQNNEITQEFKTHIIKNPNTDTDLKFIELDKATSDDLINKVMNEDSIALKVKADSEILKDEILFSSDEEDNYTVHKNYQDLPFTCALETSFYDQSDVLDKTMYVGFQTASNKSIQIFTESFAQAKSILSDEITVTDLVNNCDVSVKNKVEVDDGTQAKMELVDEGTEFNLAQKDEQETTEQLGPNIAEREVDTLQAMTSNFEGFMTASNKVIRLSQKALARCKKVFQDINLSDKFDTQIEEEHLEEQVELDKKEIEIPNREVNENVADEEIQNMDDEIIQEFENIEMSLKEDKESEKNTSNMGVLGVKTASYEDTPISESTKIKNVIKDIDFDEDLVEMNIVEDSTNKDKINDNYLPTVIESSKSIDINLGGFRTASNKNINISKEALAKTKNIFQDLGSTEFPNKSSKSIDKEYPDLIDSEPPSTSKTEFVGFKTANNKNIKISEQALAKVSNIFKEIDKIELPKKNNKDLQENIYKENVFCQPSTSNMSFVGFKTANNKNIKISKDALAKTKNIFDGIDSADFKLPGKNKTDATKIYPNKSEYIDDIAEPSTSKSNFVGFKTASNQIVEISEEALAKTKNIFKDIDSIDFKFPEKGKKIDDRNVIDEVGPKIGTSLPKSSFEGFKTANNKEIKISDEALAKTKNIFKNLESDDFEFSSKPKQSGVDEITDKKMSTDEVDEIGLNIPSTSTAKFVGFKTASNKKINITKEAMAKTKNIFQDIDAADFKFPEKGNTKTSKLEEESARKDDKKNDNKEDFHQPSTSKVSYMGFKTANNKNITISKESLARTKNIFKDIDEMDFKFPEKGNKGKEKDDYVRNKNKSELSERIELNKPSTSIASFTGFKTANNKNIAISKESLAKTKNIFKDIDETDLMYAEKDNKDRTVKEKAGKSFESESIDLNLPSTSKTSFCGFKTANNKNIVISEESLAKTKNIFKDLDANDYAYPSKEILEGATERKSPYPGLQESEQTAKAETGFRTANNKIINVSETALARTKNLLNDIDTIKFRNSKTVKEDYPNIDINIESIELRNSKKEKYPNTDNMEPKIDNDICLNNDFKAPGNVVPKFQGFQTASNKTVKVSAEALVKSRQIFQDIGVSQDLNDLGDKSVENNPLQAKKGIDSDIEDVNKADLFKNGRTSPIFKGFQTANKKPVKISEEALVKSRKLFEDIETVQDEPEPEFRGFKTGNDEEIEVSQKTLAETKKLFEDVIKRTNFHGFQTASDKKVVVSDEALEKSKKVFQNLKKDEDLIHINEKKTSNIKFGFKTGSNRNVIVSEETVARSKRRYSDIDDSITHTTNNKKNAVNPDDVANMIDTQLLNNFEESLHTEDFHDTPIKSKRSGSPILSCPRAKKRKKFETPYSQKLPTTVKKKEIIKTSRDLNKITFTENYKKNKKYTLKDLAEMTKHNSIKIDPYILEFTFDSLLEFEFNDSRNDISNVNLTIPSLKELFLNSVNSKLIPTGWVENHLKLILWKLISYEVKFKSIIVTARNVIDQLKYRYDKELYNAQRPALRKILEKDDVASKTLVLCVAGVYVDGVSVTSATTTNNLELLLTDGWYCIKATTDKMLAQLVCQGKIVVGSKIVTNGAELVNCEQGVSPWEDTSSIRLKLSGNSTRRARWDARLGYHGAAILCQLSSVRLDGGKVSQLRVFVARVYPKLYVEKFEDGSTVTRSERLEHLHQMKSESERQAVMEKIYEEVEKEFSDDESQDTQGPTDSADKRLCLDSGSQIARIMKRSKDPAEFRACLTSSQTRLLESHTTKHREHLLETIQQKVRQKVEKAGVCVNRNVVTLLKIRVAGVKGREVTKGMMSIWKPPEAVLDIIKEGAWIDVMNVVPTAVRYSEIQISAGRQSVFSTSKYKETENVKRYTNLLKRNCFTIKDLTNNPSMVTDYNEIDTVGFIFLVDPSIKEFDSTKQPFQNVFLADVDKNIICVNFWGGLKKFGYENVLDTGQIVYGANLQKRAGNTRKSIPQYRVTEFSYFTKMPKNENARVLIDDLSKKFLSLDRRKFCEDCVVLKNNYAALKLNNENVSPYRFNNSDFNMSKHKVFIDSPLARPNMIDDNLNLTGLDFESTFKQTDTQHLSEEVIQRKKKVNEKIARLKMYGEPPPLSTIHIINKSRNASSSYKSPLNSTNSKNVSKMSMSKSDSSVNVASVKETPEKYGNLNDSDVVCSPVLMNRTYVKSVNPVKLNFDVKDNNDSNIDNFAEEFDASPPLSLD
ncbi:hypothetical protein PYW08_011008 [Mythimna loreyi]|uniref:Uncharacterized protein n=1 Tax=Mythimna loreyi TaxID=667449 RepID=A0ACC2Q410_9NEOP|nr:hypothetical protein PYW08_011008 [Mythimna loreyi]